MGLKDLPITSQFSNCLLYFFKENFLIVFQRMLIRNEITSIMKLNFQNILKMKSYILRETTMCVDICVHVHIYMYICINVSIYIQIFLPGIGQMYMCSFLVT